MTKVQKNAIETKIGDIVTANSSTADYHIKENQKYQILDFDGECILVMTDQGETEWLARDYFVELS